MKKALSLFLALLCMALCACGASSAAKDRAAPAEAPAAENAEYAAEYGLAMTDSAAGNRPESASGSEVPSEDPSKIIYSADVTVETTEFDSSVEKLMALVDSYGVNGADFYSRSQGYASRRSADYLLRIPSVSFETLMGSLTELGNVPYSHTYTENVTARYYDAQARLTAYTAQETRLLEMMEKAQTVPDVIAIEEKITELRYQIESLQSSLKNWDRQVTYSSVNVSLQEVREYSPESEISYGQRLWLALKDGLASVGDFFKDLLVFLVGALPALAVLSLLALILVPVGKKLSARRKARKQAEKENQDK